MSEVMDNAVAAAYEAMNCGPLGVQIYVDEIRTVIDAALPILLTNLAEQIESEASVLATFTTRGEGVRAGLRSAASRLRGAAAEVTSDV